MKNIERQKQLDKKKWLASEKNGFDTSGMERQCFYCPKQKTCPPPTLVHCVASQEEREEKCLCAKAYNLMYR